MSDESTAVAEYRAPKAELTAGADIAPIVPRNADDVFRLAKAFANSGLAPRDMANPEKITVAIMAGMELGLPPFQAVQSFAVINGRPSLWGDGFLAVIRSNGFKVKEWFEGEGDRLTAFCTVTRPDNGEEITRQFSIDDAKKAGLWGKTGPWTTSPRRMLQMRARGFAGRDGAADVLRGFQMREEVEDYTQASAPPQATSGLRLKLEARGDVKGVGLSNAPVPEALLQPDPAEDAVVEEIAPAPPAFDFDAYIASEAPRLVECRDEGDLAERDNLVREALKANGAGVGVMQAWASHVLARRAELTRAPKRRT